jgi:hypothetical protein
MAERAGRNLTLAEIYDHFGRVDAAEASPLYERVAVAIAASPEALLAIETAPPLKRHPTVILAALHDLVLQGRAPALAAAYDARAVDAAGAAAVEALCALRDEVVAIATKRQTQTNETGRCAILYPAIAEAARRAGATSIGLVDVGCSAGLNLNVDRVGIAYSDGTFLGEPDSVLQLQSEARGGVAVPANPMPPVVARIGVDLNPVDVTDDADARWLRACLWPDQPERLERLNAAIELRAGAPPTLIQGDAVEVLADAVAKVPADALAVLTTTWALAYFSLEDRLRFLRRVDEAAAQRPVAWVSAESVGIGPAVPTMGDSRRAPHSLVGIAVAHGASIRVDTVARCQPHGAWLEWLAS